MVPTVRQPKHENRDETMSDEPYIMHYGVLGMKWGVRKDRKGSRVERKAARKKKRNDKFDKRNSVHRLITNEVRKARGAKPLSKDEYRKRKRVQQASILAAYTGVAVAGVVENRHFWKSVGKTIYNQSVNSVNAWARDKNAQRRARDAVMAIASGPSALEFTKKGLRGAHKITSM